MTTEEELANATEAFDRALDTYVQATRTYQNALVRYMSTIGVKAAQPKLDEALNRIGHVETRIIESERGGKLS